MRATDPPRGLFVTGTDTGVGKTVVAAALVVRYRGRGPVRYWKPIQTGLEQDDDTAEVARLARCEPREIVTGGVRLPRPVSPHLAARLSGITIDIGALVARFREDDGAGRWIVEGAGGVLVPVNDEQRMVDLMVALSLPVLVVAQTRLGTINHTLLTLEALRHRRLEVAGVVLVGPRDAEARAAIERYGQVVTLGEMPVLDSLTPAAVAAWAPHLVLSDA